MDDAEIKKIQGQIDDALEIDDFREANELYIKLAAYFTLYENYEAGLDAYKKALSICEREGWKTDAVVAQRMIAETYCTLGEYEEAVKYADLYLDNAKQMNLIEEQRGHATRGRIYFCWAEFLINEKSKCVKTVNKYLKESLSAYNASENCMKKINNIDRREKCEMKSRLFQNMGSVMGALGNYPEAAKFFTDAIQINREEKFKENLYWCYFNYGEYSYRAGKHPNASNWFDLAAHTASTKEKECDALKMKAKVLMKSKDILNVKKILRYVHRKQHGRDKEALQQLRLVIFLCKVEKMIQSLSDKDYGEKKKLYERQGDAYCCLKLYKDGAEAYLKMLECAERVCTSPVELLPCYTSLAQTYRDDGQYTFALFYCEKELQLIDKHSREYPKTCLFLAELYDLLNHDYDVVYDKYNKALKAAWEMGDKTQESIILTSLIEFQNESDKLTEAEENRKLLEELKRDIAECSDEDSNAEVNTETFLFDVKDDELFSDDEDPKPKHQARRGQYKVKRNLKGETDLHVAVIRGDEIRVRRLLDKGHPVNERDSAGWSILHEACNHGHIDIIRLLLNHGAKVNDPGGKECGGITPLHDAASNGHLDVIKLLLQRGACTDVTTEEEDTPLDSLKKWRERVKLNPDEEVEYEEVCNLLKTDLDSRRAKQKRRRVESESDRDGSKPEGTATDEGDKDKSSATNLYRCAIDRVRRRHDAKTTVTKKPQPALISEEEVVDEWLEEDMETGGQTTKRRKIQSKSPTIVDDNSVENDINEVGIEALEIRSECDVGSEKSRSPSPVFNVRMRPVGVEDNENEVVDHSPEVVINCDKAPEVVTNCDKAPEIRNEIVYKFRVPIVDDVFLIGVTQQELDNMTVQWLADEVASKYHSIHGQTPDVLLMTGDNAIALGEDPLRLLTNEELKTRVKKWKKHSLGDVYVECVKDSARRELMFSVISGGLKPDAELEAAMNNFEETGDLILRDKHLESRHFLPVLRALERGERSADVMDLSRNCLGNEVIGPLADYLESRGFRRLYLASNGITASGVKHFAMRLSNATEDALDKVSCLDFSFNNLGDESAGFLNLIIQKLKNLDYLGTEYCGLTTTLNPLQKRSPGNERIPTDLESSPRCMKTTLAAVGVAENIPNADG